MSSGISLRLDEIKYKLDFNLPELYVNLCNNASGARSGYSDDFTQFVTNSNTEVANLQMSLLELTPEVNNSAVAHVPAHVPVVAPRLDSRHLPRLDTLKFSFCPFSLGLCNFQF